ncbi:MAG: lipoyl(octanoyl) transferase LipB [Chloroflexota bacterium]
MQTCLFARLGVTDYLEAWEVQKAIARRRDDGSLPDSLIILEHPHTYTLGRRGKLSDVLVGETALKQMGVQVCHVDRGGEVTYHGPGQIVAYPIVDVRPLGGPAAYVRTLEAVLIHTLGDFGLDARREDALTGVWVGHEKIAAIGVKISRGITTHGFALNVDPDLSYFRHIVPCGIQGMAVTSMERLLGVHISLEEVALRLAHHFGLLFRRTMEEATVWRLLGSKAAALASSVGSWPSA